MAGWLLAVGLLILGVRLAHIGQCGGAMPITDAWNAEGVIYLALDQGTLSWRHIVAPHNEHRVAFTRLLDIALLRLNGQWDNRLQCVAGAFLHASIGVLLAGLAWSLGGRKTGLGACGFAVAVFAPPYAMNDVYGFNTQYDFVVLLAVVTIALLGLSRPLTLPWSLGLLAGFAGLFTAGSGLLAAPAVAAVAVIRGLSGASKKTDALITMFASAAVFGAGLALNVSVPYHEPFHAQTVHDLLVSFGKAASLSYPHQGVVVAAVLWLPFVALLAMQLRRPASGTALECFLLGLGVWVLLQAAAVAYSRGALGGGPDRRHLDVLLPGLLVNGVSAVHLFWTLRATPWRRRLALTGWSLCAAWVLLLQGIDVYRDVSPAHRDWAGALERDLRAFVVSRGAVSLDGKEIPFPEAGRKAFIGTLTEPRLRQLFPAELREPLHLRPSAPDLAGFDVGRRLPDPSMVTPLLWWSSFASEPAPGPILVESVSLTSRFPLLRFGLAGHPSDAGNFLEVVAVRGASRVSVLSPEVFGESPRDVTVLTPSETFVVRAGARGRGPRGWFCFTEPTEVGRLSWLASRATESGPAVVAVGLALALALVVLEGRQRRREGPERP